MDTFQAIEARRAVKHYDPQHKMTEGEIERLLSAAMRSPTSFNIQNWRFLAVTDPELRSAIEAAAWNQKQITESSLLVILCGDLQAWAKEPQRYWRNAPAAVQSMLVPMIGKFYEGQTALQTDEVHRSCGMAAQTIMLAAKAMGYDTCPMVGFDFAKVAELIRLPDDHIISMMITVGKALKPANARSGQLDYHDVVIQNRFPG